MSEVIDLDINEDYSSSLKTTVNKIKNSNDVIVKKELYVNTLSIKKCFMIIEQREFLIIVGIIKDDIYRYIFLPIPKHLVVMSRVYTIYFTLLIGMEKEAKNMYDKYFPNEAWFQ